MKKIKSDNILSEKKENKKTFNEPRIDDSEEYFVRENTINQEAEKTNAKLKESARTTPKQVATPLPPLNFNQTGNICPIKHIRPLNKMRSGYIFCVK